MLHKCPVCGQQTLEAFYDEKKDIPFYICQNDKCEEHGNQMTDIEVEQ